MRVLGIDFGEARIGFALSDASGTLASPLPTLHTKDKGTQTRHVEALVVEHEVERIVVGLPLLPDGSEGDMARTVEKFATKVARVTGLEVVRWDERYSSLAAEELLRDARRPVGRKKGRRIQRGEIDQMAACLLLQDYLDSAGASP